MTETTAKKLDMSWPSSRFERVRGKDIFQMTKCPVWRQIRKETTLKRRQTGRRTAELAIEILLSAPSQPSAPNRNSPPMSELGELLAAVIKCFTWGHLCHTTMTIGEFNDEWVFANGCKGTTLSSGEAEGLSVIHLLFEESGYILYHTMP